jgi:hypothetical protein
MRRRVGLGAVPGFWVDEVDSNEEELGVGGNGCVARPMLVGLQRCSVQAACALHVVFVFVYLRALHFLNAHVLRPMS